MQRHAVVGQTAHSFREDAVIENYRRMGAGRPCFANGIHKRQFRSAISGQILHQQHALAFGHHPFDAGIAPVTFGLFAHISHRQCQPFGHQRCKGNARRLAARDVVKRLKPRIAHHGDA